MLRVEQGLSLSSIYCEHQRPAKLADTPPPPTLPGEFSPLLCTVLHSEPSHSCGFQESFRTKDPKSMLQATHLSSSRFRPTSLSLARYKVARDTSVETTVVPWNPRGIDSRSSPPNTHTPLCSQIPKSTDVQSLV